ncbi:MAG TPA: hypothetical protein VGM53_26555, partial [Streptosporangiaceae bacterium]
MIRFSAALVAAGLGLLLAGALTSELSLVYAAIGVSLVAAILLAAGVFAGRDEILGRDRRTRGGQRPAEAHRGAVAAVHRTMPAGSMPRTGTGPASAFSRPGTLREEPAGPATVPGPRLGEAPGGRPAAPAAPTAGAGTSGSGLGWPAGESPADALWARVDAELAASGASADAPKLTK